MRAEEVRETPDEREVEETDFYQNKTMDLWNKVKRYKTQEEVLKWQLYMDSLLKENKHESYSDKDAQKHKTYINQ